MHIRSAAAALVFTLGALSVLAARAEDDPAPAPSEHRLNEAEAQKATGQVDADPALQRMLDVCPADVFGRDASLWVRLRGRRRVPVAACEEHPSDCLAQCTSGSDPEGCLSLALALQRHQPRIGERYAQILFARTCALGLGAGCTNRAASIRNAPFPGDPFADAPQHRKEQCEFRSFTAACGDGDAWGCAMLGQSYRLGEGTEADAAQARRNYQKSCAISPAFAACDFARGDLRLMDAGR